MSSRKSYAVFGLGKYGFAVAKELAESGADVLAVDIDETLVNSAIASIPYCKCADVTDAEVVKQLGVADIDVVIVAMANSLEASVMSVMLCKELGVKTVIAKCSDEMHGKILSRCGVDKIVFPEKESGARLAKNLLSSGFVDVIELSADVSLLDLDIRKEWLDKTLADLNLRKRYGINVIAFRKGEDLQTNVDPTLHLTEDMQLVVIANRAALNKLKD